MIAFVENSQPMGEVMQVSNVKQQDRVCVTEDVHQPVEEASSLSTPSSSDQIPMLT